MTATAGTRQPAPARPRAVLLVANPADPYSRGLRVARSLAGAGYDVEIAATAGPGSAGEERDGDIRIVRREPSGPWARFAHERRDASAAARRGGPLGRLGRLADNVLKLIAWPAHVRGWWRTLERDLPPADLYHAFGILTIPVALSLARAARRRGQQGRVVYDVIDVILESNNVERIPGPFLALDRWRERRWARSADAIVTVNDAIAGHLDAGSGRSPTRRPSSSTASRAGTSRSRGPIGSGRRPASRPSGRSSCSSAGWGGRAGSTRRPRPSSPSRTARS